MSDLNQNIKGGVKPWLVALIVIIIGGMGGVVWYYFFRPIDEPRTSQAEEAKIQCNSEDEIICEYITSWEEPEEYKFTITETTNDVSKVSIYEYDLSDTNTPRIHTIIEGGDETITIGNTLYTKWDGFWSKKTIAHTNGNTNNQHISKPSPENAAPIEPQNYKKVSKEKCGELNCFKYKITDPQNPGMKQFIWFDDLEYKLRQLKFVSGGTTSDQIFEYVPVNISAPSPVKESGQ